MKTILRNCVIACAFPMSGLFAQDATQNSPVSFEQMALDRGLDSVDIPGFVHYQLYGTHMHDTNSAMRFQPENGAPLFVGNPGFESGDFTSWTGMIGDNTVNTPGTLDNQVPGIFTGAINPAVNDNTARHSIMTSVAGNDPVGLFPIVPAGYGNYVSRLGHTYANYNGESIEQTWTVAPSDTFLFLSFAVVISDGSHPLNEGSYFEYQVTDTSGNLLFSRRDEAGALPPAYLAGSTPQHYYLPWTTDSLNVQAYVGMLLTVRIITSHCIWSGHYAYCYLDLDPTDAASVGMTEQTSNSVTIFPNPSANGLFQVEGKNNVNAAPLVYDISGRLIHTIITPTVSGWIVDLSGCAPGVYSLAVPTDSGITHCNLVR